MDDITVDATKIRKIIFVGDSHIGNPGFCEDAFDTALKELRDEGTYVVFMGDAVEGRCPLSKFYDFHSPMEVGEQYEYFFERIKPYRSKIIGITLGNHEMDLIKKTTIDPIKSFCSDNRIRYFPGMAMIRLKKGNNTFNLLTTHGSGGGIRTGSSLNKMVDFSMRFIPDAIVTGHYHKLAYTIEDRPKNDGTMDRVPTHVILNGSFLRSYNNGIPVYSEIKNLPPCPIGYSQMTFSKNMDCIVRLIPL